MTYGELRNHVNTQKNRVKACDRCRSKKVRCNGLFPCTTCLRKETECTYQYQSQVNKVNDFKFYIPSNKKFYSSSNKFKNERPLFKDILMIHESSHQNRLPVSFNRPNILSNKPFLHTSNDPIDKISFLFRLLKISDSSILTHGIILSYSKDNKFNYQGNSPMGCLTSEILYYDSLNIYEESKIHIRKKETSIKSCNSKLYSLENNLNPLEEALYLNSLKHCFQKDCIKAYFQRFHSSFPVLSISRFAHFFMKYSNTTHLHENKKSKEFHFLLNVMLLITCSRLEFPQDFYMYLERAILLQIKEYYLTSSEFVTLAFLLLRTPPSKTLKLMKWTMYGKIALRSAIAMGAFNKITKKTKYNRTILNRIAGVSYITDMVFSFVLNLPSNIDEDSLSNEIFTVPLENFYKCLKSENLSKSDIKDLYMLKWLITYHNIYNRIHKFNNSDPFYNINSIHAILKFELELKILMSLTPKNCSLVKIEFELLSQTKNPPQFFKLHVNNNKLNFMIQLWYYCALITLHSKALNFKYLFVSAENKDDQVRSSLICLSSAFQIVDILSLLSDNFFWYYVAYKWYPLNNSGLVLARYLVVYNIYNNPLTEIHSVPLETLVKNEINVLYIAKKLGKILGFMEKWQSESAIVQENLKVLISYLDSHGIEYSY